MATTATIEAEVPGRVSRWRARWPEMRQRAGAKIRRVARPARAPLENAAQIPLTVAGIGLIDAGAFQGPTWLGLVITGLSLFGLEHLIADETDPQ